MERQRAALARVEHDDEGGPAWEEATVAAADEVRAVGRRPPLEPWWATKTERELHERARALGLLGRAG